MEFRVVGQAAGSRPDDSCMVLQACWDYRGLDLNIFLEGIIILRGASAQDDGIWIDDQLHQFEKLIETLAPLFPAEVYFL